MARFLLKFKSVMSNTVKTKFAVSRFAGLLRGLFRCFEYEADAPQDQHSATEGAPSVTVPQTVVSHRTELSASAPIPFPENLNEIKLPLQSVLAALPLDLRAKIMNPNTAGMTVSISTEKALTQLATGSVKITFGELRRLAPGIFANSGGEYDAKPVALPLSQILAQINPALLARHSSQKQHVGPADNVSSPFDARGQGLTISTESLKAPAATPPPPISRIAMPVSEKSAQPLPVAPPTSAFVPRWTSPAVNGSTSNVNGAHTAPKISAAPAPQIPPATPPTALPEQSQQTVLAPLAALLENWPEALRMEIVQLNLANAKVALPVHLIEPALKRGRVIFSWRYVRSWIKPIPPAVSVHDGIELELPLKVLAPLFFGPQNGAANTQRKVSVAEEIPNLFFGFPQPAGEPLPPAPEPSTAAVATPRVPDTNYFTRNDQPQTTDSEFARKPSPGTDFASRFSTPSDIVARAEVLECVVGVLIALPDGLMVASKVPAEFNADTLAAFLPQIFSRVSQCSNELRMGDLNNLSFTVGNVPWKIFRVNAVYFAAFGRAGQSMPTMQLAALAAELDRKKQ
jgi:predicted regulator of Ras-like GTPase activity (Roadblock/LC7/MglB family)